MKIKPFARQGHFTMIDNAIFDLVMPKLSPNSFKVLMFIIRKTIGFQKDKDAISYSQIKKGTGIKNDLTVNNALKSLLSFRLIEKELGDSKWDASSYSLNTEFELALPTTENVAEPTTENVAEPTTENVETKRKSTKETKKEETWTLPTILDSEKFREAWDLWERYRKQKRQTLTLYTKRIQLKRLAKAAETYGIDAVIGVIEESIGQGWTGLFPERLDRQQAKVDGIDWMDIKKLVVRYGYPNYQRMKEAVSERELEIIQKMGGWRMVCEMNDYNLQHQFREAANGQTTATA